MLFNKNLSAGLCPDKWKLSYIVRYSKKLNLLIEKTIGLFQLSQLCPDIQASIS